MSRKITDFDFSFDSCFEIILGSEGGYSNDPRDPGGETKYGISKKAYPNTDIKNLTIAEAKNIYLNDYWVRLNRHETQLNLILFDCAINQGLSYANSLIAHSNTLTGIEQKLAYIATARENRYRGNPRFNVYGRGWLNRLADVTNISKDNLA